MKTEIITRIKLTAAEGMMLTDGETFGKEVYLAPGDSPDNWQEITKAEAQERMDALNPPTGEVIA